MPDAQETRQGVAGDRMNQILLSLLEPGMDLALRPCPKASALLGVPADLECKEQLFPHGVLPSCPDKAADAS